MYIISLWLSFFYLRVNFFPSIIMILFHVNYPSNNDYYLPVVVITVSDLVIKLKQNNYLIFKENSMIWSIDPWNNKENVNLIPHLCLLIHSNECNVMFRMGKIENRLFSVLDYEKKILKNYRLWSVTTLISIKISSGLYIDCVFCVVQSL